MKNERKFVGLKDVILVALLTAICLVICTILVLPFAANILLVLWIVPFLEMLICGPIYMLAVAKAPRIGTHFIFAFLFSIYYFVTNGMPLITIIILVAGIVGELLLLNGGYQTKRVIISYSLFGLSVMLAPVILMFANRASMVETMLAAGLSQEYIDGSFAVYSPTNIVIGSGLSIVGSILGYLIGRRLLKKHFAPAGIVEDK